MKSSELYDVIIIGGGPAGLTAAIYLSRARYRVLVMEKEQFGGQITITSEVVNYPGIPRTGGRALTDAMQKQAAGFGAEFLKATVEKITEERLDEKTSEKKPAAEEIAEKRTERRTGKKRATEELPEENGKWTIEEKKTEAGKQPMTEAATEVGKQENPLWVVRTDRGEYRCFGLLAATGAHPRMIGFEGEEEFRGHGVAYCATCDGEFFTGKEIFVVGGGFAAAEESVFLTKYASHVTILVREPDFTCAKATADAARQNEKITVLVNTEVEAVTGDAAVTGIRYVNNETGERTEYEAPAGDSIGVFVFAGYEPATELFAGMLKLDEQGYIVTDRNQRTDTAGIYAAGDVCEKNLRQVVTAVGDGATAATELEKYAARMQKETGIVPENERPGNRRIGSGSERQTVEEKGRQDKTQRKKELKTSQDHYKTERNYDGRQENSERKAENSRDGHPAWEDGGRSFAESLFDDDTLSQLAGVFDRMEQDVILEIHPDDRPISRELAEYMNVLAAMTERLTVSIVDDREQKNTGWDHKADGQENTAERDRASDKEENTAERDHIPDKEENTADRGRASNKEENTTERGHAPAKIEGEDPAVEENLPYIRVLRADGSYTGLAFHGVPGGHEFTPFILSLFNASGPGQKIDSDLEKRITAIDHPVHMKIMVSLTCEVCPDLVTSAQRIAAGNRHVTAEVYDFAHFPQMSEKYHVLSVPCLIVNEDYVTFGKKTMKQLLDILETVG